MPHVPLTTRLGRRRAGAALVLALSAGILGACAPSREPFVDDPRACPRTNVELDDVLEHFALGLPPDAADVRFYGDRHPMFGDRYVELRFSAPPAAVSRFVAEAERSREGPWEDRAPLFPDECLELTSFEPSTVVHDVGPQGTLRTIAVDDRDPEGPIVYVGAADAP